MLLVAYKYRIYPNKEQELILINWLGQVRFIWNYFLSQNHIKYEYEKKFIFAYDMAKQLPDLKKQYDWIDIPSGAAQNICFDLDLAIKSCIKKIRGYPKFKSKKHKSTTGISIPQTNNHIRIENNKIKIPKLDYVNIKLHRSIDKIKNATITRTRSGKWYVSLLTEVEDFESIKLQKSIGIDLGLTSFLTTSDNERIDNPRIGKRNRKKLKKLNRIHSRKKKGSKNKEKARIKLARKHEQIVNQRKDFLHKTSIQLIRNYDLICAESLKIKNLLKNKNLAFHISDANWRSFLNMLLYKSKLYGKHFHQIDTFYPSTKICSSCNHKQDMKLNQRTFNCENCNLSIDRDYNAAMNIHTAGTAEIDACGDIQNDLLIKQVMYQRNRNLVIF